MRSKDKTLMAAIEKFVSDYTDSNGISPTMQEVADGVGSSKATVQRYIAQLCDDGILDYSGYRTMTSTKTKAAAIRVPVLGTIACGTPITAEQNVKSYIGIPAAWHADFALECHGDSMAPTICDGDVVCIRSQPEVEQGQIAAVRIGEEATLKHFYRQGDVVSLIADNPAVCPPMVFAGQELEEMAIEGLAVGYCRGLV